MGRKTQRVSKRETKITSMMNFFGLTRVEAIEELVDAGEIKA